MLCTSGLWITSFLHAMARRREKSVYASQSNSIARWWHAFDTVACTQTYSPGGSTGPGTKSDVYDCAVAACNKERRTGAVM